jgi:multidrug efflux pump
MIVSLSLTPVLCVMLLRQPAHDAREPRLYVWIEAGLARMQGAYLAALTWVMRHRLLTLLSLLLTVVLNVYLYATVPKGFFPAQDTGVLMGAVRADQNISFQALKPHLMQIAHDLAADPDVEAVMSSTGSGRAGSRNTGDFFIRLKDYTQRTSSAAAIANRLTRPTTRSRAFRCF